MQMRVDNNYYLLLQLMLVIHTIHVIFALITLLMQMYHRHRRTHTSLGAPNLYEYLSSLLWRQLPEGLYLRQKESNTPECSP